ncbi:MAG: YdcF family protein [Bacteroidota bacterium]
MFFILSKVLYFLIQPINWILFPLLYTLFGKNGLWKKRTLIFSICAGLFFTNHFIFNVFINLWEVNTITADQIEAPYDIGILLGGYSNFFAQPDHDRHNFNERGARFFQTYELYKKGKFKKFLLSGGSGFMFGTQKSEAILTKELLLTLGVPEADIIVEPNSKNTFENALFTKEIIAKDYPDASCLLITSAWHMRRSMGCFDRVDLDYTPFSVDFISEENRLVPAALIIPNSETIKRWEMLIKEMVGMIAYKGQGYL